MISSRFSCFKPIQSEQPSEEFSSRVSSFSKPELNHDHELYHPDREKGKAKKLKEKPKKKESKPMNKNANLPKFLIRIFIKYVERFKNLYVKR